MAIKVKQSRIANGAYPFALHQQTQPWINCGFTASHDELHARAVDRPEHAAQLSVHIMETRGESRRTYSMLTSFQLNRTDAIDLARELVRHTGAVVVDAATTGAHVNAWKVLKDAEMHAGAALGRYNETAAKNAQQKVRDLRAAVAELTEAARDALRVGLERADGSSAELGRLAFALAPFDAEKIP